MNIAILGWGSLLWDQIPEFDDFHHDWKTDGPLLRLEFSRISRSRQGALTLVIDEQNGEDCQVAYAISRRRRIEDAISDLRCREGTTLNRIGHIEADKSLRGEPDVPKSVDLWLNQKGLDGVVWTGLQSNFAQETGNSFSVENATKYLQKLSPEGKARAAEYIWRAPRFITTSLRRALEVSPWFPPGNA